MLVGVAVGGGDEGLPPSLLFSTRQQVFLCEVPASSGVLAKRRIGDLSWGDCVLFKGRKVEGRG